jgi:hypothetical protein
MVLVRDLTGGGEGQGRGRRRGSDIAQSVPLASSIPEASTGETRARHDCCTKPKAAMASCRGQSIG